MNMTDELERLSKLHKDGSLNDEEFAQAKRKLLSQPAESEQTKQDNSLGEAANRNVTSEILLALIGAIVLLRRVFESMTSEGVSLRYK
jgi:hypothetical protein